MIKEPDDLDHTPPVLPSSHLQTDDELTTEEANAKEIWLRVQQMMKGTYIGIQEKEAKFLNKLGKPEWKRYVTRVHQMKKLQEVDYNQLYDYLKQNHHDNAWIHMGQNTGNLIGYNALNQIGQNGIRNQGMQNVGNQTGLIVVPAVGTQNGNVVAPQAKNNVSKPILIPDDEFLDNIPKKSVARKFLNGVKDTIVTLQRVVKSKMSLNTSTWSSHIHQEIQKVFKDEIPSIINQIDVRVTHFEKEFLKEAANFLQDYKSLTKEADESLKKIKKHKANVKKNEKLGSEESLASPRPSKLELSLGYQNLFMVLRLGLFQAYDKESKAAHQLCLEVYGNGSL
ncbi:hypothetical protein Tco_0620136 [Tanacetum coccineum]